MPAAAMTHLRYASAGCTMRWPGTRIVHPALAYQALMASAGERPYSQPLRSAVRAASVRLRAWVLEIALDR